MSEIPKHELLLYRKLCNDFRVVFDVGCRDDIDYYQINPNCEYHLFEPHIVALNSIKEKISKLDNHKIILNEFGLFNTNLDNQIYYENTQSFIKHWSVMSKDRGHRYSLKTLDYYVETNNIEKIDFLKVDVEGVNYEALLGGLKTIKEKNIVSFIQVECSGKLRDYVDSFDNFNWFLMMEPRLLKAINKINKTTIDFSKSLIILTDEIIKFIDVDLSGSGAGGNILGINKNISLDIVKEKDLAVPVEPEK